MEDWGIFQVDQTKPSDSFKANVIDLGTKLTPRQFIKKCYPHREANQDFEYPTDRLLPLRGIITDELMHNPNMWDTDCELCLLVVKNGTATGTTIGCANSVFSIVRKYYIHDMSINDTSMEWAILNYNTKSEIFSEASDSGSIIANICGHIGGMLTGRSGKSIVFNTTYATPFWWLLERIHDSRFPHTNLNVVA